MWSLVFGMAAALASVEGAAAPAPAPPPPAALAAVRTWLEALAAEDASKLRQASALPFTYATDAKRGRCDGVAKREAALGKILKCVVAAEKPLIAQLRYPDTVMLQGAEPKGVQPIGTYPSRIRTLVGRLGTGGAQTPIEGYINGDAESFEFIFAVRPIGQSYKVSGVLLHRESAE